MLEMFLPWLALATAGSVVLPGPAPLDDSAYKLPPPEIVRLLDAPPTPIGSPSPNGEWLLLVERPAMPSIAEVTRPWLPLAGMRIDPALDAVQRLGFSNGLSALDIASGKTVRIGVPKGARIMDTRWSHAGSRLAFTIAGEHGVELWMADATTGVARKLASPLNAVFGPGFEWMPDGRRLLVTLVPRARGTTPSDVSVPTGPAIQETAGTKTALRTYQDLLTDAHDERLFEYHGTCQLALLDPMNDALTPIGEPGLISDYDVSPDGLHVLVTRLHRPFSYVLPAGLFPQTIEVWNLAGQVEHRVVDVPMGESIPQEGVRTGPRDVQWNSGLDATLAWCEAQDGGDPKAKAEWRDRWVALAAPFTGEPREIARLHQRAQGVTWFAEGRRFLASEYDRDRRWTRQLAFDAAEPARAPIVFDDRSVNDRYGDPGQISTRLTPRGTRVVRQDGDFTYRVGRGASKDGDQPFLDRLALSSMKTERMWRCAPGTYETFLGFHVSKDSAKPTIVTSFETPTVAPNYRLRDLARETVRALTDFPDPQPELRGVTQELVKYERADGVALSATLYLPKDREPGVRLPMFVWAYPLEFTDAATAGQVSGSSSRFVRVRGASEILFALHGYAVLDNATMPIVGDPETMNDTFVQQIVDASKAAIDYVVDRGIVDRDRVAVGGHSYGAFMTANLLAHCDLFRAGVARSGAYNRTLTPFGFQSERRTLWEAPDSYIKLSPFLCADKIDEPLLMIHGEKDSNQGTFPIQSERLYQAIKGNGGTARLVMLPGEAHGYSARESVLHTVAEMFDWCDRFVRDARPRSATVEAASGGR